MRVVAEFGALKAAQTVSRASLSLGRRLDRRISAVIVSVPPGIELPLHTHAQSDDFFVVLKGAGVVLERNCETTVRRRDSVWVPAGCPHGLRARSRGVVEVGFQCPPDRAPLSLAGVRPYRSPLVHPVHLSAASGAWSRLVIGRKSRIAVHAAKLRRDQTLHVGAREAPFILLVLEGAVQVLGRALGPLSLATLAPTCTATIVAIKPATLLLRVAPNRGRLTRRWSGPAGSGA
jgi:quercetin dioxygenase-like cupin family protein